MQPAECSTELVIDSIVLNTEVLHSIRNNLPVPVEHLVVQKIPRTKKANRSWLRYLAMAFVIAAGIAAMVLMTGCGGAAEEPEEETVEEEVPQSKEEAALLTNEGKADFNFDICEKFGWYNDGTCEWFCPGRDSDCDVDPLFPEPRGDVTQNPIVLAHGFMGSPTNFWAFEGVKEALEADGHIVYVGEVAPFNAPSFRAEQLASTVDQALAETGASKVNIIAHSMGGIDARFLASPGGLAMGDKVASITTISSPHQGTKIADVGLKLVPGVFDKAIDALLVAIGRTFSNEAEEADFRASLEALAEQNMPAFNEATPNDPNVIYESWAGISSITGIRNGRAADHCEGNMIVHDGTYDHTDALLWALVPFVANGTERLPNDGMSTVLSSKWGEFRGCIPADHLDEVGQIQDEADLDTGFDHVRFYRNIAFDLAGRGM